MTIKKLILSLIAIVLMIGLSSCIKETVLSDQGTLTYFKIQDQSGVLGISDIDFTITQPATELDLGLITNTGELFPYNSLSTKLIPSFNYSGGSNVIWNTGLKKVTDETADSIVTIYSGNTAMDFSYPSTIVVISEDKKHFANYRIVINANQTNPDQVIWSRRTQNIDSELKEQFSAFYLNDKLFVLTGEIIPSNDSVFTKLLSSTDGASWTEESISSDFPKGIYRNVIVFNNKAYITGYVGWNSNTHSYEAREEIWSSADGKTWIKSAYPEGMHAIFKNAQVFNNKLYVWGGSDINTSTMDVHKMPYSDSGSLINADYSFWSFNGTSWSRLENIKSNMPVRFSTSTGFQDRLQVYGGEYESGNHSEVFWSLDRADKWINFPHTTLDLLVDATLIGYDDNLWMFGGTTDGNTLSKIMISMDAGQSFTDIASVKDGELAPPINYSARANQQVVTDHANRLYIIGGYNRLFIDSVPDITQLLDVWSAQMNKFKD